MSSKVVLFECYRTIIVLNKPVKGIVYTDNFFQNQDYEPNNRFGVYHRSADVTTECATSLNSTQNTEAGVNNKNQNVGSAYKNDSINGSTATVASDNIPSVSATKIYALLQHIYAAQARVQLEVNEIKRAQAVATSAQRSLEEAANNVRVITAALQSAQQEVAAAAVRAQAAQMQLAAHDQLLFAARQKVDALSSQMVGLQAEDGVGVPKNSVNVPALLAQLKEPLSQNKTPTPIPAIDKAFNGEEEMGNEVKSGDPKGLLDYFESYKDTSY